MARPGESLSRKIHAMAQPHHREKETSRMVPRRSLAVAAHAAREMHQPGDRRALPLRDVARAHELLEHASVSGKIALMCQEGF